MTTDPMDFSDLEDLDTGGKIRADHSRRDTGKAAKDTRFPCASCSGTGRYHGPRVHQEKTHCFACKGNGYFLTSEYDRQKSRAAAQRIKQRKHDEAQDENRAHDDGALVRWVGDNAHWNSFAESMLNHHSAGKTWSERQVIALRRMIAKTEASREAARKARSADVDLSPIRGMFEAAVSNGHKKPTYRAEGLVISRAPDTGRNPGALYVKNEEAEYGGKVLGSSFTPSAGGRSADFTPHGTAEAALRVVAADPLAAALRYGARTGRCACCGRELTNGVSVEAGIGPICREKWGL